MQSHVLYIVLAAKRLAHHREDIRETGVRIRCENLACHREDIRETGVRIRCEKLGPRVLPLGFMLNYKLCCFCAQH